MTSSEFETKIWDITFPCIVKEIKKGAKTVKELEERCGASKSTVYRIIKALEKAGLVEWKKGEYVKWKSEIQAFESKENYEIALNHSKRLFLEAEDVELESLKGELKYINYKKLLENKYFINHLKTGYPEIFELYEEWKKIKDDSENKFKEFLDEVRKKVKERGFKIKKHESEVAKGKEVYDLISTLIFDLIRDNIRIEDVRLSVDEERVYCEPYKAISISSDPSMLLELRELIISLLNSEKLRKIYDEYRRLRIEENKVYSQLEDKIKFLVEKVKHGEPLRGYCGLCPLVIVKEVIK